MNRATLMFSVDEVVLAWAVLWKEGKPVGILFAQEEQFILIAHERTRQEIFPLQERITDVFAHWIGSKTAELGVFMKEKVGDYEVEYVGTTEESVINQVKPLRADLFWDEEDRKIYFLFYDNRAVKVYSRGVGEKETIKHLVSLIAEGYYIANINSYINNINSLS